MKILELCDFSAGICGVWNRVREESVRLKERGYDVLVLSSNLTKGNDKIAEQEDEIKGVKIKRFSAKKLGGESFMSWFSKETEREIINFKPDIIIAHSYRHPHTIKALRIGKKIGAKVFLVTHAPFARERNRTVIQNIIVLFYDMFIGKKTINNFDKVIAISKWEKTYLVKLGLEEEKIVYIPNGIPEEFFKK
jgi:glycosyltransferase involved in cell wall biosynthesis